MKLVIANMVALLLLSSNLFGQIKTFRECVDSALVNNTQLAIAKNHQLIASLKYKEVKANWLPKMNVNGEYKYFIELPYQLMPQSVFGGPEGHFKEAQFGVPHNINASAVIQVPVYSSNLIGNINRVKTSRKIIDLQMEKTFEEVYFEISNIYRNAQLLQRQILFIDSIMVNTEKVLKSVELLVEEKLANRNDIKKLQLKVLTLRSFQSDMITKLEQLYNGLQLLTGIEKPFLVESEISMLDLVNYENNGSKELDFIKLQKDLISVDLNSLKRSRFVPEVGLVATYGIQGLGFDQSPNRFLNFYPIGYAGIKFTYPLFNGTITQKRIGQKSIEFESLSIKEKFLEEKQRMEIENARSRIQNAYNNVMLSERQVSLAQSIYLQEEKKYQEGLVSINDLMVAQNEHIETQQNYLQHIAEYLSADLILKKITNNISNSK